MTKNNADKAYEAAKQIETQNRHVAVIGHHYSSCSIRAGKIYQKIGIPAISPASTNILVTRNNRWYYRTIFNDYLQSIYLAIYVKEVLQKKQVSIIQEDQQYGSYLGNVFEAECKRSGLSIAYNQTFSVHDPELDNRILNIVKDLKNHDQTDVIFLAMHSSEGVKFVKAIKDNHIDIPIITPDAFASQTFQKRLQSIS
jgi:ABC-type branched-chain amino acid transport systems, periplasmic component